MVQHDLFEGNPDGWNAYVAELQKKVTRFGAELPKMKKESKPREAHNTREEPNPVEASVAPAPEWGASDEKRGWPWPQPGSTS